ncbi:MAG: HlyD family efflux transporter periplasmic adaptor subunit [Gammaproteobacteria bacterium]
MDISRHVDVAHSKPWWKRKWVLPALPVIVLLSAVAWTSTLRSALPAVKRDSLYFDSVKKGDLLVEVRAPGNLVPIDKKWLSSRSEGLVKRVNLLSGVEVSPDTVVIELENPDLDSEARAAELALRVATATLVQLKQQLADDLLVAKSQVNQDAAQLRRAKLDLAAYQKLAAEGIVSRLDLQRAESEAERLEAAHEIDERRYQTLPALNEARLNAELARHAQSSEKAALLHERVEQLKIRAGVRGVLQDVSVEAGQRLAQGTPVASVSALDALKAQLRVEEGQAREIKVGLAAKIQVNGTTVDGKVTRVNGAVENGTVAVDIIPEGPLPPGVRPDLRVDGTIRIENLPQVLFVGKPSQLGSAQQVNVYVVDGDRAVRRSVTLGRRSAAAVQVLSGLNAGDSVILSDASAWGDVDAVEIQ